jgi:NADH-quinone oxidoreductase subunit M
LWGAFFLAFAIKTPIVPFHLWLPKAHVDSPTTGSVILAGILLKVGIIGILRLLIPVFPQACIYFAPFVAVWGTIGVLYSTFITLKQIDIKRIIAYSSVAHINIALVSVFTLNDLGVIASVFVIISHGIISSALFFLIGFLYQRFHQRLVFYYSGLATIMPLYTCFFFFFSLSNIAFPLTIGFIGEFLCLTSISSINLFLGFLNSFSILLTTVYSIVLFSRIAFGTPKS